MPGTERLPVAYPTVEIASAAPHGFSYVQKVAADSTYCKGMKITRCDPIPESLQFIRCTIEMLAADGSIAVWEIETDLRPGSIKSRENSKQYQRRKKAAPGYASDLSKSLRSEMWHDCCWICGDPKECMDHVKPLIEGGSNWPANLRPICFRCNSAKGAQWFGAAGLSALAQSVRESLQSVSDRSESEFSIPQIASKLIPPIDTASRRNVKS